MLDFLSPSRNSLLKTGQLLMTDDHADIYTEAAQNVVLNSPLVKTQVTKQHHAAPSQFGKNMSTYVSTFIDKGLEEIEQKC